MIKSTFLSAILIFVSHLSSAQNLYELDENYPIKESGLITISTNDANIVVTGTDKDKVHLNVYRKVEKVGTGSDEKFELKVEERNGNLFIKELRSSEANYWIGYKSIDYRLTLEIPKTTKLVISEDDGDLKVTNVMGDLDIKCEDGDLELDNIKAKKINIGIEDGDVQINNSSGFLSLKSEDGDVEANKCAFDRIDLDTEDGDVNIETSLAEGSTYTLESEDGDIKFYISGDGAKFDLKCDDGYMIIDGDFNITSQSENFAQFDFGDKSASVYIKTEDGDIKVSR